MGCDDISFGRAFEDWIRTWLARSAYRRSFRALRLEGDEDVLELGVGGGQAARVILAKLDKGGTYTGFDVDLWWFERAKRNLARFDNVTLAHGDVRDLPLEEEGYDLVVIHLTLHDIPEADREPIVIALVGKLRKGGVLFIKEPTKAGHGMPEVEVWRLMDDAGLHSFLRLEGRSVFMGPIIEGHFRK
ncbi:MAG: class I SAM-dependent methyltransferase [Thermoplasmata archaeon]|nr:MAG: class I SAM-dependent methyltransferase [Thermoplasmata archaeon]